MYLQTIQLHDRSTLQASAHVRCPHVAGFSASTHKAFNKAVLLQLLQCT